MSFPTSYASILSQLENINPLLYGKTRNYINGSVTRLSPYISRGVISTNTVYKFILKKNNSQCEREKLIQELAWRDYWQLVWSQQGEQINSDLRHEQSPIKHKQMPSALLAATTGLQAVDKAITDLYHTGYMHNHLRMYVSSIACNIAFAHWLQPAKWMYYHLLDGDWGSNALSWQWVAGTNSYKKYYCNQENINKYTNSIQRNTFLDMSYEELLNIEIPDVLRTYEPINLFTTLPEYKPIKLDDTLATCVYTTYNLDPTWRQEKQYNRILLLEPLHFSSYPVSGKVLDFIIQLSKNIEGLQIFVGGFQELIKQLSLKEVIYKKHPFTKHFVGTADEYETMFDVPNKHYSSFSAYWKQCEKQLR